MTWRTRLAEWLIRNDTEYVLVPTEHYLAYVRMLSAEEKLRALIQQHMHLSPTLDLLLPRKGEVKH
jgi:hypothetical protein